MHTLSGTNLYDVCARANFYRAHCPATLLGVKCEVPKILFSLPVPPPLCAHVCRAFGRSRKEFESEQLTLRSMARLLEAKRVAKLNATSTPCVGTVVFLFELVEHSEERSLPQQTRASGVAVQKVVCLYLSLSFSLHLILYPTLFGCLVYVSSNYS